jgi:arsenate reductase-like glutaredoxin family protein
MIFVTMLLIFGGVGPGAEAVLPSNFITRVEMYITDGNKADKIKIIIQTMNDGAAKLADKLEKQIEKLHETNSNYHSNTSELSENIDDIFKLREQLLRSLIVMRSEIRDLVTEEEWIKLFDRTEEAVDERMLD